MAMKSFRINKASKKLKARSAKMAEVLVAGIEEERRAASELMKEE